MQTTPVSGGKLSRHAGLTRPPPLATSRSVVAATSQTRIYVPPRIGVAPRLLTVRYTGTNDDFRDRLG